MASQHAKMIKVLGVVTEMFRDRGYLDIRDMTVSANGDREDIANRLREDSEPFLMGYSARECELVLAFFMTGEKLGISDVHTFEEKAKQRLRKYRTERADLSVRRVHVVVISECEITPMSGGYILKHSPNDVRHTHAKTTDENGDGETVVMESFRFSDMSMNVTKHKVVPRHTLITKDHPDHKNIKGPADQLPMIKIEDMLTRWYDFRPGDTVKTEFRSPSCVIIEYRNVGCLYYQ